MPSEPAVETEAESPPRRTPVVSFEERSIHRTDPVSALLRARQERLARVGRTVIGLLGVVTVASGTAAWISAGAVLGIAVGAFGAVLIVIALVQHLLLRRDRSLWPERAVFWNEGLELVLHNGEVLGASWSDPDLLLGLVSRPAPSTIGREYLLLWMAESRIPAVELSAEGFELVRTAANTHHLRVTERRRGGRSKETLWLEIRSNPTVVPGPVRPVPEVRTT